MEVEWNFCMPWILGGMALVAMEVAADFGAVAMFNYDTLSTSIYKVWFDMQSWAEASQLASLLVLLVFLLSFLRLSANAQRQRYTSNQNAIHREKASWLGQIFIYLFLGVLILLSLIVPIFQLFHWTIRASGEESGGSWTGVLEYGQNSFFFGFLGAIFIALLTFVLSHCLRFHKDVFSRLSQKILYLGYALPGTVLAVGVLGLSLFLGWGSSVFSILILMFLAYMIRFQPLGIFQISSAFERLSNHLDESAIILGHSRMGTLKRIHFPLMKRAIFVSGLLIFIEIIKEMPLTLMLRPFGWDTLAVKVFEFTSEGDWERGALPALVIVFFSACASWFVQKNVGVLDVG